MNFDDFPRPKTAAEAREMIEDAIEATEYEKVEFLKKELASLENYEEMVKLGGTIASYFDTKDNYNDECKSNIKIFNEQLEIAKKNLTQYFVRRFKELRSRQKSELEHIFNEWDEERTHANDFSQEEYIKCLETSKIMMRSGRMKEAIELRDKANASKSNTFNENIRKIDKKYEKICSTLQNTHRMELETLAAEKESEEKSLEIMKDTSDIEALRKFLSMNSNAVLTTSSKISPKTKAPTALKMQIVNVSGSIDEYSQKDDDLDSN